MKRAGFRWMSDDREQRLYHVATSGYGKLVWGSWYSFTYRNARIEWDSADWELTKPVTGLFVLLKTREVINEE